jgi:hypothetical protein
MRTYAKFFVKTHDYASPEQERTFMSLTFQGYFEDGKFITDDQTPIPEHKTAIVTFVENGDKSKMFMPDEE